MRITERRLRSIIRNIIAESNPLSAGVEMSAKDYEDKRYDGLPPNKEEIAQELEREGHKDLADHLRGIWSEITGVFEPYDVVN